MKITTADIKRFIGTQAAIGNIPTYERIGLISSFVDWLEGQQVVVDKDADEDNLNRLKDLIAQRDEAKKDAGEWRAAFLLSQQQQVDMQAELAAAKKKLETCAAAIPTTPCLEEKFRTAQALLDEQAATLGNLRRELADANQERQRQTAVVGEWARKDEEADRRLNEAAGRFYTLANDFEAYKLAHPEWQAVDANGRRYFVNLVPVTKTP